MKPVTIVSSYRTPAAFEEGLSRLIRLDPVESAIILTDKPIHFEKKGCRILPAASFSSGEALNTVLGQLGTKYLLLLTGKRQISIDSTALEKMVGIAESTRAGLFYSDFYEEGGTSKIRPLNDYRLGSVRDDFDFGEVMLFSMPAVKKTIEIYGELPRVQFAGLYDLRLKLSIEHAIHHISEPLYQVTRPEACSDQQKLFAYLDPRNQAAQKEMETVFTDHLKRIGAYLPPNTLKHVDETSEAFPVEASVIIPVRNREETIGEAVGSALSQKTDFRFNVIIVDNHSDDGTSQTLSQLSSRYGRLHHMIPLRKDLQIGGCWNEALYSDLCGRYAVQLDSDDLYGSPDVLQRMIDLLRETQAAMVIGSYTLVDSKLKMIPRGTIDHREWTDGNGHNNALRVNGLGAPRAFDTGLMRRYGFLNVSYGEDYAAALRICREYRVGRIYESLYLCRRWSGNTDSGLSIEEANRNDAFKDEIRTQEILARQKVVTIGFEKKKDID